LAQQNPAEVLAERASRGAGEAEERVALALLDKVLPARDVGFRARMESGGVGNADVEIVPRIALYEKARDVSYPRLVDAARTPIVVRRAAKIPCDAPHGNKMIPTV